MKQEPCRVLVEQLHSWLHRKTISSSIRRIATLPIALATDIGLTRNENQDRVAVMKYRSLDKSHDTIVIALADGMGGMVGGANAASLAISSFFSSIIQFSHDEMNERLAKSIKNATDAVFNYYAGDGGSTLSAVVIEDGDRIVGVNVGDSRIYKILNGKIEQLSEDDTVAALAQKYNEAELHLDRRFNNELVQFIGFDGDLEPHFYTISKDDAKTIILTSDGAHTIGDDNINRLFSHSNNTGVFVKRTIDLANWFGGADNSSIVAIDTAFFNKDKGSTVNGVINIWDPYGELQIVNVFSDDQWDKNAVAEKVKKSSDNKSESDIKRDDENNCQKITPVGQVVKKRTRARSKKNTSATKNVKKEIYSDEKNKDQLDISFNDKYDGKRK